MDLEVIRALTTRLRAFKRKVTLFSYSKLEQRRDARPCRTTGRICFTWGRVASLSRLSLLNSKLFRVQQVLPRSDGRQRFTNLFNLRGNDWRAKLGMFKFHVHATAKIIHLQHRATPGAAADRNQHGLRAVLWMA